MAWILWLACTAGPPELESTPPGSLVIESEGIDLGAVALHSSAWGLLPLRNDGEGPLHVFDVRFDDDRQRAHWALNDEPSFTLEPGSSRELGLVFTPQTLGELDVGLEILSDDPDLPSQRISLKASSVGEGQLRFEPAALSFGEVALGQTSVLDLHLQNVGNDTLTLSELTLAAGGQGVFELLVNPSGSKLPAGSDRGLASVAFTPSSAGVSVDALLILSDDADQQEVSVVLTGTGVSP